MDDYLKNTFNKVLSIGSNCQPKQFINKTVGYCENELFDYIGTSMWSINELFLNDFKDITDPDMFKCIPIFKHTYPVVTNTKYYLRFKHDLQYEDDCKSLLFTDKITRRIGRLKYIIRTNKRILFIRLQENQVNRIKYLDRNLNEHEEIEKFLSILNMQFTDTEFTVIYINTSVDGWNSNKSVLSVKTDTLEYPWETCHILIRDLFIKKDVIQSLSERYPTTKIDTPT